MIQTQHTETLDALQPVVIITTTDTSVLLSALLVAGASVTLKRDELSVRGLTARQVADLAAEQVASVTDLTTSRPSSDEL